MKEVIMYGISSFHCSGPAIEILLIYMEHLEKAVCFYYLTCHIHEAMAHISAGCS